LIENLLTRLRAAVVFTQAELAQELRREIHGLDRELARLLARRDRMVPICL
jgi:hypothetical protein